MNNSQTTSIVLLAIVAFIFWLYNTGKLKPIVDEITGKNAAGSAGSSLEDDAAATSAASRASSGDTPAAGPSVILADFSNVAGGMFYDNPTAALATAAGQTWGFA